MSKKPFDAAEVRQWLEYDGSTGSFLWLRGKKAGKVAGSYDGRGYRQIQVLGSVCKAHRLAWLMSFGVWPSGHIDHVNHKTDDNRIDNLRDVTVEVNAQNQIKAMRNSSSGFLGVKSRKDGRFESRIAVHGKRIALGSFGDPESAHAAYIEAKRSLHAGCTL